MTIEAKEAIFDVLLYLFDNYTNTEKKLTQRQLFDELEQAGFREDEINDAFQILQGLLHLLRTSSNEKHSAGGNLTSIRVFATSEQRKLNIHSRGFLLFLEQMGLLSPTTREWVINRAMEIECDEVDVEQLKWIVLMVLFNQPDKEISFNIEPTVHLGLEQVSGRQVH